MDFSGKTILVTGGGTGIGAATAAVLTGLGAHVIVLGPDQTPLEAIAAQTGALAMVGDAATAMDVQAAIALATAQFGGLDGLAACAGGGGMGKLGDTSDAEWDRAMRITLDTAMVSARECLPSLIARKGSIVLVSSIGGIAAPSGAAGYVTAKAALIGMARSMANDYGPDVRVNVLCPGLTATEMGDRVMDGLGAKLGMTRAQAYAHAMRFAPLGRAAAPAEIARTIAFLLSDWSSFITGAAIIADGGQSAISAEL